MTKNPYVKRNRVSGISLQSTILRLGKETTWSGFLDICQHLGFQVSWINLAFAKCEEYISQSSLDRDMKPVFRNPNYHTKSLRSNPFPSHLYPDVGATFSRIILLASIIAHAKTERPILSSPLNVYSIRRFPSIVFNLLPGRKFSPTFLAFTQPDLPIFQFSVSLPCCFL